jgi:uncharacterized protein (TIGR02300 family)
MPEIKLGNKFDCYSCGTKFYDLGKSEPICPKCGANQKDASQAETALAAASSRRKRKAEVAKIVEIEEDEPIADVGDEEMVGPELEEGELDAVEEEEELEDEA